MCPTNLRMDFNCVLSNASAAVTISEDSDTAHQVINIAALDPDLDPLLDYQVVSVMPDHFDSKFYAVLQSTMCASTCVHNVCLYVCPQCVPVRVSTMCACTCVHNVCQYTMCACTCVHNVYQYVCPQCVCWSFVNHLAKLRVVFNSIFQDYVYNTMNASATMVVHCVIHTSLRIITT